jgi:alkylhydroperoxidase family enzyme
MARIRLRPVEELTPALRRMVDGAVAHNQNPAIFQAVGHLPEAFEAFWEFYTPLRLQGILEARLKELVRLKIASLNNCFT